jgi:hypothetical protein
MAKELVYPDGLLGPTRNERFRSATLLTVDARAALGVGGNNLLFDGTYNCIYDEDLREESNSSADITYQCDDRNCLSLVVDWVLQDGSWVEIAITCAYDMFNNLSGRTVTGSGAQPGTQRYVFDGTTWSWRSTTAGI